MAWLKIQDNSRRASTGASMSSFVRRIGSLRTTYSKSAAQGKSLKSLASPMQPYYFGFGNTASRAEQLQKPVALNIGAHSAQITRCGTNLENSIQTGAAVSPLTAKRFMQAKSGNQLAAQFGNVTRQRASDADLFTAQTQASRSTSTTSHPLLRRHCGQRHQTCCLFVSLATSGFIQEGM